MFLSEISFPIPYADEVADQFVVGLGEVSNVEVFTAIWMQSPSISDPAGRAVLSREREIDRLHSKLRTVEEENKQFRAELKSVYRELARLVEKPQYVGTAKDILAVAMIDDGHFVANVASALKTVMHDANDRRYDLDKYKAVIKPKIELVPDEADNVFASRSEVKLDVPASQGMGKLYFDGEDVVIDRATVDQTGLLKHFKAAEEDRAA